MKSILLPIRQARNSIGLASLLVSLFGCAHFSPSIAYYDPTTYKNLTDLKPEVQDLYDSFTRDPLDKKELATVRLKLAQMYEYEHGKGDKNADTYKQIDKIKIMYQRQTSDRLKNGKWNQDYTDDQKDLIATAFNIAIETENLKNKNER